ncbi:hypothetical protein [Empedobacter brevis]|uniref:hypothetical protein n=1 Tax=Empedobacter brevis TaxID=247 RepID=UPI0039AFAD28
MNKILYGVLISSFLISCGDKKGERSKSNESNGDTVVPVVITDPLKISLNAIISKDDTLEVYYRFEPNANFESMYVVSTPVVGKDSAQNIVFDLPTDKKPYDFRIDFGNNKEQSDIQIKNFNMQYKGNSFNVKDTLFYQYFWNNEFIDYTRNKAIVKPKSVNGTYDPIFMPREVFATEVNKLFNPIPTANQTPAPTK